MASKVSKGSLRSISKKNTGKPASRTQSTKKSAPRTLNKSTPSAGGSPSRIGPTPYAEAPRKVAAPKTNQGFSGPKGIPTSPKGVADARYAAPYSTKAAANMPAVSGSVNQIGKINPSLVNNKNVGLMNAARNALRSGNLASPTSTGRTATNTGGPSGAIVAPGTAAQVTAPTTDTPATATPQQTAGNSGAGSGGGSFTTAGRNYNVVGPIGMLQRAKRARGPVGGLSITPELLRRAAQQRFSRTQ